MLQLLNFSAVVSNVHRAIGSTLKELGMWFVAIWNKIYRTLASVRTGIILLLLTVIVSAVGTVVLQRPTTEPEEIQRAYSPQTLAMLDRLGLTDVYHTWWFIGLLGFVSLSIIFVSIERWPNAWRFYARPYRFPEPHFRATLPLRATIPVADANTGLSAVEKVLGKFGFPVERNVDHDTVSLYSERHRFSVFAVYVVHASLLMIFFGGIVDAIYGYRGYLMLNQGQTNSSIELRSGSAGPARMLSIPFSVRADKVGMETYTDGAPKKYWSELTIIDKNKEIIHKTINVNDPLTYRGIRLFQAGMGKSDELDRVELIALGKDSVQHKISLKPNETIPIDGEYSVRLARFVPDYYTQDGEVFKRSDNISNPAFQLALINKAGAETKMWLMPRDRNATSEDTAYRFAATDIIPLQFTGLEVAYQPGQWFVWGGVVLMAIGLSIVFYMSHTRIWAVIVNDDASSTALWIGGACNRNKEKFETRFQELVAAITDELNPGKADSNVERDNRMAHV
jgi:cytochrome c biogenesis protein